MEDKIYTITPNGNYSYKFKKILSIYINDTDFSREIWASIRFITMNNDVITRAIYCNADYVIYNGKKYYGLDDIYKLQAIIEREKINDLLSGM